MTTLTYDLLEDLLLAQERRKSVAGLSAVVERMGPLAESIRLADTLGRGVEFLNGGVIEDALRKCLATGTNVYASRRTIGFTPAIRRSSKGSAFQWTEFCLNFQKAMVSAGFQTPFAQGIVGAVVELERNVHEHSGRASTGFVGYAVLEDGAEFFVGDCGVGVHASIRQAYPSLRDSGDALYAALSDGFSRHGEASGRGMGFRQLFLSLASHSAELRFRSDDQILEIRGPSPALVNGRLSQKRRITGFSVSCYCARPGH